MDPTIVEINAVLWAGGTLETLQEMLVGLSMSTILLGTLSRLLGNPGLVESCELHRVKFKPGRKLSTYHQLSLRNTAAQHWSNRQIAMTWQPPGAGVPPDISPESLAMQDEALQCGLAQPFQQLLADIPAAGMRMQIAPLDARFPQLVRVSDPNYAREILAATMVAAPADRYTVTAIRYRPGERHMLRYDPADGSSGTVFAKVYNNDKGARTFGIVKQIAGWLAAQNCGLKIALPQAYIAPDQVVLYPLVSGTPLTQLLRTPGSETGRLLRQVGVALGTLHRTPLDLVELQPHSFAKEIKSIVSASEHVHPLLPATGSRIRAILDRASALHERLPQEAPGLAYGDFKADHLWVTPDGLVLIDFDTCYLFDPAIDLGKFLADLHYWYDTYGQAGVEEAREQFLAGYDPGAPAERLLRARLYEVLVLIKTTVRRVRLFDSDWAERTERLVGRADALLRQAERM
jgi:hypothetical protein